MKSCFEGHKRGCIYHSHKSPIICVIPFCVLPLLEDAGEIQQPIPQGSCPHRETVPSGEKELEECALFLGRDLREWCAFNHSSQLP